jgi:hypothetical protein
MSPLLMSQSCSRLKGLSVRGMSSHNVAMAMIVARCSESSTHLSNAHIVPLPAGTQWQTK